MVHLHCSLTTSFRSLLAKKKQFPPGTIRVSLQEIISPIRCHNDLQSPGWTMSTCLYVTMYMWSFVSKMCKTVFPSNRANSPQSSLKDHLLGYNLHVGLNKNLHFFLRLAIHFSSTMHSPHCLCPIICQGTLGCFHILAVVNSATIIIGVLMSFQDLHFNSFG